MIIIKISKANNEAEAQLKEMFELANSTLFFSLRLKLPSKSPGLFFIFFSLWLPLSLRLSYLYPQTSWMTRGEQEKQ